MTAESADIITAGLAKVLADSRFATSPRLARFLRHTVMESLAGRADLLKESLLGIEVFERGPGFDPRLDPIVRVQAGKLRAKLRDYYENQGAGDPLRIEYPKGGYAPRFEFRSLTEAEQPAAPPPPVTRPGRRRAAIGASAVMVALAAVGAWQFARQRAPAEAARMVLNRLTYDAGSTMFPVISRDGKLLVYSSDRGKGDLDIWVQPMPTGEPVQLTHHEAADLTPDLSPDAKWVVFRSHRQGGGIYMIPAAGGQERKIVDRAWVPRFSPDGEWIVYQAAGTSPGVAMYVVGSRGGQPHEVSTGKIEVTGSPIWTRDGGHLVFSGAPRAAPPEERDWYMIAAAGGEPSRCGLLDCLRGQGLATPDLEATPGDWLEDSLVFSLKRGTVANIWKIRFDEQSGRVAGPAIQLTSGSGVETYPRCSAGGRLVFTSEFQMTHVFSLPLSPATGKAAGAPLPLTADSSLIPSTALPRLSADGSRLAFVSSRSGHPEVAVKDLSGGRETILPMPPAVEGGPLISPDGSMVAFGSRRPEGRMIYRLERGRLAAKEACEECGTLHDWSQDGLRILYEPPSRSALALWDRDSGARVEWLHYPQRHLRQATLSPDQHWLAMVFQEPGGAVIAPMDEAPVPVARFVPVTAEPDVSSLHWSADGRFLYFFSPRDGYRCLWAQRIESGHPAGDPFAVYHFHTNRLFPWSPWASGGGRDRIVFTLTEPHSNVWTAAASTR